MSTYKGAAKELEKGTFGFAAAAAVIAKGLSFVAAIRSVNSNGGGGVVGRGAAATQAAPASAPPQVISIRGLDPSQQYSGEAVIGLVDEVQKELKNRGAIITFV